MEFLVTARKNPLHRWNSPLHRAMQTEIGRQMLSEYELPHELPARLAGCVKRLELAAAAEAKSPSYMGKDRRQNFLQRAMACEVASGKALDEGIKEIYLDLAAQWRDLAHQNELFLAGAAKHK